MKRRLCALVVNMRLAGKLMMTVGLGLATTMAVPGSLLSPDLASAAPAARASTLSPGAHSPGRPWEKVRHATMQPIAGHATTLTHQADPVIHVNETTGVDETGCGSPGTPACRTIPFATGQARSGDTIQVAAGTYRLTGLLFIRTPDLHFKGAMAGVNAATRTPGRADETVVTGDIPQSAVQGLFTAEANGVSIDGFTFEGNARGAGVATDERFSGYVIKDNIFTNNVTGLVPASSGAMPSMIERNFFYDNYNRSIVSGAGNGVFALRPFANVTIADNTFHMNRVSAVNISGGEVGASRTHDITIENNDMSGQPGVVLEFVTHTAIMGNQMVGGTSGIAVLGGSSDLSITDNVITDKTVRGIDFSPFLHYTNVRITIASNIIERNATAVPEARQPSGIELSGTSDVSIRDNLINGSGASGIAFSFLRQGTGRVPNEDAAITQNTITGSGGPGISLVADAYKGHMTANFNKIAINHLHQGIANDDPEAAIDARNNWWGCSQMPHGAACDHPVGAAADTIEFDPWLLLQIHSVPADILAGEAATIFADLRHNSAGTLTTGPFFAPVTIHFTTANGHLVPVSTLTIKGMQAQTSWPAGQPRPERICGTVGDPATVCLTFAPQEVSLQVTKTAAPNPATAGRPVTFTITITNGGPGDAFGVTVDDDLAPVLDDFTWTCVSSAPPSACSQASGTGSISTTSADVAAGGKITYTLSGVLPARTAGQVINTVSVVPPPGTTDPGCTPGCSGTVTLPVTRPPGSTPPLPVTPTLPLPVTPTLPVTGPQLTPEAAGGTGLVALGGLILLITRRRKLAGSDRSRAS